MNSGRVESVSIPGHLTGPEALAPQFVERMLILILGFVCSTSSAAWAQAGTITKDMQTHCTKPSASNFRSNFLKSFPL